MNKFKVGIAVGSVLLFATVTGYHFSTQSGPKVGSDDALLSLIKNDLSAFESYLAAGGDLHAELPLIDGKTMTVAQGMAYFGRHNFIRHLQSKKKSFLVQNAEQDILTIAIQKNDPELLALLLQENPDLSFRYGDKRMTLVHLASEYCSHKTMDGLMKTGKFKWEDDTRQGFNAITLAAENECLPLLTYWKDQGVNFNKKDKRGISAMRVLSDKNDPTMRTFVQSFEVRMPASVATAPSRPSKPVSFYKKRIDPKDMPVDYSALIEPEGRPEEVVETAAKSEFAD